MVRVGSALAATTGQVERRQLAEATGVDLDQLGAVLNSLADHLALAGIGIAQHDQQVWLVPRDAAPVATDRSRPLDVNEARLLRRIARHGPDIIRNRTHVDRTVTLPRLLRRGLIDVGSPEDPHAAGAPKLSLAVAASLRLR